jgi:hypothetical protein
MDCFLTASNDVEKPHLLQNENTIIKDLHCKINVFKPNDISYLARDVIVGSVGGQDGIESLIQNLAVWLSVTKIQSQSIHSRRADLRRTDGALRDKFYVRSLMYWSW